MNKKMISKMKLTANALVAAFVILVVSTFNTSPANAFAGTLENGNMAYAQGSGFDKGEACNYLPGITADVYDAWHFVLTSRGATFQQSPTNPAIAINLNFVFMRQDGSLFVIKSGAWVQTGKGAYTYTLKSDRIRMVQAGTVAQINGLDSGMRLSHTCPGTGSGAATTTTSPSPTPTPTASTSTSPSPSPTATSSSTPTASPSATPSTSTSASPSASASPTASSSPTPSNTRIPTRRPSPSATPSAIQSHPTGSRSPLPTPTPTQQYLTTPSPTPTPTPTQPTQSPTPTPTPSESTNNPNGPAPVVPTPPPVDDPQNVQYIPPTTPTTITPTEPPASPIVITTPPQYGKVTVNNDSITYTPNPVNPNKPVVDLVVFQYTNLSGATVVVRKEFIVTQSGDVPKIIQTGFGDAHTKAPVSLLIITLFIALTAFGLRGKKNHA